MDLNLRGLSRVQREILQVSLEIRSSLKWIQPIWVSFLILIQDIRSFISLNPLSRKSVLLYEQEKIHIGNVHFLSCHSFKFELNRLKIFVLPRNYQYFLHFTNHSYISSNDFFVRFSSIAFQPPVCCRVGPVIFLISQNRLVLHSSPLQKTGIFLPFSHFWFDKFSY